MRLFILFLFVLIGWYYGCYAPCRAAIQWYEKQPAQKQLPVTPHLLRRLKDKVPVHLYLRRGKLYLEGPYERLLKAIVFIDELTGIRVISCSIKRKKEQYGGVLQLCRTSGERYSYTAWGCFEERHFALVTIDEVSYVFEPGQRQAGHECVAVSPEMLTLKDEEDNERCIAIKKGPST